MITQKLQKVNQQFNIDSSRWWLIAAEKNFENKVKRFLTEQGCYYIKTHGDKFSRKGTPDLIINCNGFFVAAELKASNGKPSELQLYHVDQIKKSGGIAMVLYPNGFEGFQKLIKFLKTYKTIGEDVVYYADIIENHSKWEKSRG